MSDHTSERSSDLPPQDRPIRRTDPAVNRPTRPLTGGRPLTRASSVASDEQTRNLKPAFVWWTFCQWWKIVLPVGLVLASIAAAFIVLSYKPDYKSSALVMVEESAPYIAFTGSSVSGNMRKYVQTQVELLRSSVILGPVLARPEVAKLEEFVQSTDALGRLQKRLRISRVGGSELYKVSYTSKSPQAAADVANAVVAEYLSLQSDEEFHRTQRVIDILEEERRRRSLEVERIRQKVVKLGKDVTGRDPFSHNSILDLERANNPSTTLFQELAQLDVQLELVLAEIAAAKDSSHASADHDEKSGLLELEIAPVVSNHPSVIETENAIAQLHAKLAEIESLKKRGKQDSDWKRVNDQVREYEEALAEIKAEIREAVLAQRAQFHDITRRKNLSNLQRELDKLHTRRSILTQKFEKSVAALKKNGGKSIELEFARAELLREEKVFELIASRKLAMQTELRAPTRVRLRQKASKPKRPVAPLPYKMLTLACSAAFAAPFGLAVLREFTVQRISNVEQLSRETPLRILGEISHFPIKQVAIRTGTKMSGKLSRQMFLYNESIDSLRTSLWLADDRHEQQVLVVTSAAASEGKTSVSTSLAMSIANAARTPTLIIDADMRAPDVATVLATPSGPGLYELLSDKVELKDVIKRVGNTQAYVLPAGRLKGNPHHLVQNGKLEKILHQLRKKFPAIIIDSPPVFGGSEALVFAKQADGVIVATLNNVSRTKQVNRAVEKLEHAGANVLGAVLNGRSANSYAYSYGYGYYSGRTDQRES